MARNKDREQNDLIGPKRRAVMASFADVPAMLSIPEAMKQLTCSRTKIYQLIKSKQLVTVTLGADQRIPKQQLIDYLAPLGADVV